MVLVPLDGRSQWARLVDVPVCAGDGSLICGLPTRLAEPRRVVAPLPLSPEQVALVDAFILSSCPDTTGLEFIID